MSYRYKKTKNNTGFSLIELLIVIAIIGILMSIVLSSLKSARVKAKISSWKSSVSSSQPEALSCCSDGKNLNNSGTICDGGAAWPSASAIGTITVQNSCDPLTSTFQYTATGAELDITNSCQPAVCNQTGCVFQPVDASHKC